jgi:hypothetical protein
MTRQRPEDQPLEPLGNRDVIGQDAAFRGDDEQPAAGRDELDTGPPKEPQDRGDPRGGGLGRDVGADRSDAGGAGEVGSFGSVRTAAERRQDARGRPLQGRIVDAIVAASVGYR